jgi:hypothetical protein
MQYKCNVNALRCQNYSPMSNETLSNCQIPLQKRVHFEKVYIDLSDKGSYILLYLVIYRVRMYV